MWFVYALLSAVFAASTSILAKIGLQDVNSNLATALRTIVVLVMAWVVVLVTGSYTGLKEISTKSLIFLGLSGLGTGLSWLCYFRAIQIGDVNKVVPVDKLSVVFTLLMAFFILHEKFTVKSVIGSVLIAAGTFAMIL